MDSISKIFSTSTSGGGTGDGGWLSKVLPMVMLGQAGSGVVGNIMANKSRNQVLSSEMAQMQALEKLTPAQITQGISQLQQPLSQNLINNVGNSVQGQLATRGLSQAPGIYAGALAQGLAPYQLQEQQMAQDAFFKKLGLPISARPSPFGPFPQSTNTSQLWQAIMQRFMKPDSGNITNLGGIPQDPSGANPVPGILQQIIGGGNLDTGGTDFSSTQPGGG